MSARDVIAACQRHLPSHPNDCSGFVRAVAQECGVLLFGDANSIADQLTGAAGRLPDGIAAARAAASGALVIGGVQAPGHGHVVVVVNGPLGHGKYPYAFWGKYHSMSIGGQTINAGLTHGHGSVNWAFSKPVRDKVRYAAYPVSELLLPPARDGEGLLLHTFC